jgi:F-type H+-transporting ATPase subunit a
VLILIITFLMPFILILPFYGLELFVGFIQAFVFAMLTLVFGVLATAGHGEHEEHAEEHMDEVLHPPLTGVAPGGEHPPATATGPGAH